MDDSFSNLDATELRVLGCLVEKAMTTPEYYPLSLNALTAACNQKSNRDPVTAISEADVQNALGRLINKHLVMDKTGMGGRVRKFGHRLAGTLSQELEFSPAELAVLAELMLRGAQTPGELRSHAQRMHAFSGLEEVLQTLSGLQNRHGRACVEELPREAGRRENRFRHTLGEGWSAGAGLVGEALPGGQATAAPRQGETDFAARLQDLEARVARLEALLVQRPGAE